MLDAPLVSLAASQYGVLTVGQLRAAGLTGSAVSKRVRRGGLHIVHPGVYAYGHSALSRELAFVIKEAAYRKRLDLRAVRAAMERANGRRNLHVLVRAIELYEGGSAGTRSPHEDAFLALLPPPVPEPLVNTQLAGFEVDFLWPEAMVVVEIDSGGHGRPPARRKDALEGRVLRAAGYTVLRFTDAQAQQQSGDVLARVLMVLSAPGDRVAA